MKDLFLAMLELTAAIFGLLVGLLIFLTLNPLTYLIIIIILLTR